MAVKLLFLSAFLIVQVSCGQNSLTFVIDDTSSMYDEISQVKNAAKSIVDIVLKEKASQIEKIVLVTFNDPEIKFKEKTRDEAKLKQALDSINVHGGGDCWEMALAGIKKGLEESRPGSYVFVFTDASAKDYGKFQEIKTLCQEKQSQIVFILTGDCNDISQPAFQVYHKIAAASNGQVFRIRKDEVRQVLEYVKETIKGDKTVIASTIVPAHEWRDVQFNIDEQTEYAIVSASGTKVVLHIFDQRAYEIHGKQVTWTDNVKVIKLVNLARGTYKARVRGNSEVNIMVFGRTDFTFQHGFSTTVQTNLEATDTQPTTGVKTHLMVSVQDETHSALITEVELLNTRNQVIMTLPLTQVEGDVYKTDMFLSPEETFKISVTAKSRTTGSTVKRVAKTPVTPIQSVAPAISKMENILKVKEGASIDVHCSIVGGKPRPQILWYVKKQGATEFTLLKDTGEVYKVTKALTNDQYKCVAKNVRGQDEHIKTLDVQIPPKFQHKGETIITKDGEPATIDCKLQKGNPRPRVTWEFKLKDTSEFKLISHEGEVWDIPATQLSNSGEYKCIANNKEGNDKKITKLVVKSKPTIDNAPSKQSAMENSTKSLHCTARGFPKPTVNWFFKGPHSVEYKTISKNTESLVLENVQLSDAGHYKCVAENEVGQTEHLIDVTVNAPPRIMFVPPNTPEYSGVEGDAAMKLLCSAVGYPTPTITWVVDSHTVASDKSKELYVENNALFLRNPKEIHSSSKKAHTYLCHAKNDFGVATQHYEVYISKYVDSGNANGIDYGSLERPYDFDCPLPFTDPNSVRWYKNYTYYMTGPSLHFEQPTEGDGGNYTCRVSDLNSAASHTVEVIFGSPPKRDLTSYKIKWSGEVKKMACYSNESPLGKYDWLYNGKTIEGMHSQSLLPIGWGQHTCQITHPLGNLTLNYLVTPRDEECGIPTSFIKTEHAPLILDSPALEWPAFSIIGQYLIVPHSEKLQLFCEDEKTSTKSVKSSNTFIKFPTSKSIYATCAKEESFLIDGVSHKISELNCTSRVTSSVVETGKQCQGENTELMRVGFQINGFTDVYQSCVDTTKDVPLYTKMNTIAIKKGSSGTVKTEKSVCVDKCCYEKIQLVNAVDVSSGPAEEATFTNFNTVNYCKPKNNTNWHDIEKIIRERAEREQFTVWSGAAKYTKVGEMWTPKYLWKVMKPHGGSEMVVIHENTETAGPKLCAGSCGEDVIWFEPAGDRTYCCSLVDFKNAFGVAIPTF